MAIAKKYISIQKPDIISKLKKKITVTVSEISITLFDYTKIQIEVSQFQNKCMKNTKNTSSVEY